MIPKHPDLPAPGRQKLQYEERISTPRLGNRQKSGDMKVKEFAVAHPYFLLLDLAPFLGVTIYNINGLMDKCRKFKLYEDSKHVDKILRKICSEGLTGQRTQLELNEDGEGKW